MREDEKELNTMVNEAKEDIRFTGSPPTYELTVTTISLLLTITLFIYPETLLKGYASYDIMLEVMPSYMWAIAFFIASMLKGVGLLIDIKILRIVGLVASSILYFIMCLSFASDFPTLSSITYGVLSAYAIVAIQQVKFTSIINRGGD